MTEGLWRASIWFTDVVGSSLMIALTLLCLWYAVLLRRTQPANVMWTYLFALSLALAAFALSRGVGHLAKHALLFAGRRDIWEALKPYSGAINTMTFVVAGSITLFFQRVQRINTEILNDKKALEEASREVMHLNENLQSLVDMRTRELAVSEEKYRTIFESSMDMVFVLDDAGRFTDVNGAGLATLGHDSEDRAMLGASFEERFVSAAEYRELMHALRTDGFVRDREYRLRGESGDEVLVLLSMNAGKSDSGRVTRYHGIAKDITARQRMERQLQRADKLASLGQISAGIAHEINNPLGIILGYAQLIMKGRPAESQDLRDLRTIEKQARNCKKIVEDLLKFARAAETTMGLMDVNKSLREVITLLNRQFQRENIAVDTRLDPDLPLAAGDSEKMKQVFMNLLVNAKQAISGQGSISVGTETVPESSSIRITVSDSGCGVPDEILEKIFDPFFTTKPVGEGTGLGLAVSYGIVQEHGGSIEVQSAKGKGTTFTIVLPAQVRERVKVESGAE